MTRRRSVPATLDQHLKASEAVNKILVCMNDALRALDGGITAREVDVILKIQDLVAKVKHRLEERMSADHPDTWSTHVYYPGMRYDLDGSRVRASPHVCIDSQARFDELKREDGTRARCPVCGR